LELEGRLNLLENEDGQGVVSANANVTLMSHNQDLLEKFEYYDIKETGLQGASDVIVNGSLVYNNRKENPFIGSLTANYASDKIYALGSPEDFVNSDVLFNHQIVEKGFVTMDMMLSKKFNKHITVKFTGRNLLNPNIDQTQEITRFDNSGTVVSDSNATVQSYKKGMNLSLGFTYSF
jgi:hypothetical protein